MIPLIQGPFNEACGVYIEEKIGLTSLLAPLVIEKARYIHSSIRLTCWWVRSKGELYNCIQCPCMDTPCADYGMRGGMVRGSEARTFSGRGQCSCP